MFEKLTHHGSYLVDRLRDGLRPGNRGPVIVRPEISNQLAMVCMGTHGAFVLEAGADVLARRMRHPGPTTVAVLHGIDEFVYEIEKGRKRLDTLMSDLIWTCQPNVSRDRFSDIP